MISRKLNIALQETIRAHAEQHNNGALDMETILEAMGEVMSDFLAEMPAGQQAIFNGFCIGVACATNSKTSQQLVRCGLSN